LDAEFQIQDHPDYPDALNGLQVEGRGEIRRLGAAVDASEETLLEASRRKIDFLLVHHGLFWGGLAPITGRAYRKVAALVKGNTNLYSLHLPLDAHPEFGNNALLMQSLGLTASGRFGSYQGADVGWWGEAGVMRADLLDSLGEAVGSEARVIPGGPERVDRVGVVTGGGASALQEAAEAGLDSLVTGEAPHHSYHDAMELGLNLFLGGHYGTETFGVKALTSHLSEEFGIPWEFLHFPTGL
jgi:dinuclear metal center YbgI/SA1388 family protein